MRSAPNGKVAIAVSGGGDSVALLVLMAEWAQETGREIHAVTVNHGLRPEATQEAEFVARLCADVSVPHDVLSWQGWNGAGNLQKAAREARHKLISDWAHTLGVTSVVTGHTRDDQAETFLMRLARGSGVDGLAGMHPKKTIAGLEWMRPLLEVGRQELRDLLREQKVAWVDDPSNDDARFDRVKIRKGMVSLATLGLDVQVLSDTATRMQRARTALEHATWELAQVVATPRVSGAVWLDQEKFLAAESEIKLRLLAHSIGWVASAVYRPRLQSLMRVLDGLPETRVQTLAGCVIVSDKQKRIEICREANAISPTVGNDGLFDGRWRVVCSKNLVPLNLRALGEDGILQRSDWRQSAESRFSILSSPSIWYNNELMSVPILDKDGPCTCRLNAGVQSFFSSILTH